MRVARYAIALFAAVQFAPPGALAAQDAAYVPPTDELVLAREIIAVMYPPERREEMLVEIATNMGRQMAATSMNDPIFQEPGIRAIADRFLERLPDLFRPVFSKHLPSIFEATAVSYTRAFTLEELQDIREFAATPSGQRYFSSLTSLLADPAVAEANQGLFAEIQPLQQQAGKQVGDEVVAYLRANPDVAERLMKAGVGKKK